MFKTSKRNGTCRREKSIFSRLDWPLTIVVLCLIPFGILAIASATSEGYTEDESAVAYFASPFTGYTSSQLMFFIIGLIFVGLILILDYNNLKDFTDVIYWIAVTVLAAVLVFGSKQRGMTGWFKVGSIGIQPAEICKARDHRLSGPGVCPAHGGQSRGHLLFWQLLPMLWRLVIPFVLICMQPDLGTASCMWSSSWHAHHVADEFLKPCCPSSSSFFWPSPGLMLMSGSQKDRFSCFWIPPRTRKGRLQQASGKNGEQRRRALRQGAFFHRASHPAGELPPRGTHRLHLLLHRRSRGLHGAAAIIILVYYFIMARMMKMSSEAKDDFGACIIFGVLSVPLPRGGEHRHEHGRYARHGHPPSLLSSGGSNLLTSMLSVGLVLNVHMAVPGGSRIYSETKTAGSGRKGARKENSVPGGKNLGGHCRTQNP